MKLVLEIITPTKIVLSEEVDEITVPTTTGEITILPEHVDLFTKVKPGEMIIHRDGKVESFAITGGFLEINNNHVNVLADHAIRAAEIEIAEAERAKERAEKAMKERATEQDFRIADAELRKAILELKVARKHKTKI